MPSDEMTSPEDPEWVDAIVRRAMERAAADPDPDVAPVAPAPARTAEPVVTAPVPAHEPTVASAPAVAETRPAPEYRAAPEYGAAPEYAASAYNPRDEIPNDLPRVALGDQESVHADPEMARLPRAEDFVSAHDPTDRHSRAMIAGTEHLDHEPDDFFDDSIDLDDHDDHAAVSSRMRSFLEWGAVIVGALAVALLIKTFLMQAYFIPSSSMETTLDIGDRVLVNKLSYAVGDISRGDLIVFHRPPTQAEGEDDLIKRVIGLGGETIEIRDGQVFIRQPGSTETFRLDEPYLDEGVTTTGLVDPPGCVEETTDSVTCTIPEGHLFMMGDNRGGSRDSRYFGPIDEDLVVGRAFLRVWPLGRLGFL